MPNELRLQVKPNRRAFLGAMARLAAAGCILPAVFHAETGAEPSLPGKESLNSRILRLIHRPVSGVVVVGQGNSIKAVMGIGKADPRDNNDNAPETIFDIGSIAKLYTAALVFKLVSAGDLALDNTLGEFLPGLPTESADITLRQCLNHSSGLPAYFSGGDFAKKSSGKALRELRRMRLLATPGTDWAYSNVGYGALALVIEAVTSNTFVDTMRSQVLDPNELKSTGFFGEFPAHGNQIASGFSDRKVFGSPRTWKIPQWGLLGGGGMAASAPDLFHFFRLLVQDKLADPALHTDLLDRRIPMRGKSVNWRTVTDRECAAGLFSFRDASGRLVFHKGGSSDFGFYSTLIWRPDVDRTAIGLFNGGVRPGFADDDVYDTKTMEHSTLYRRMLSLLDG